MNFCTHPPAHFESQRLACPWPECTAAGVLPVVLRHPDGKERDPATYEVRTVYREELVVMRRAQTADGWAWERHGQPLPKPLPDPDTPHWEPD